MSTPEQLKRDAVPVASKTGVTAASVHLDSLRGAAALVVFLNHTRALYFESPLSPGDAQTPAQASTSVPAQAPEHVNTPQIQGEQGGTIRVAGAAVVIFFVLSGYLVGGSVLRALRKGQWSWGDYFLKRITRLMVVLLPAVLLGTALDRIGLHAFGAASIYNAPPGLHLRVSADLLQRSGIGVILGNLAFLQGITVPVLGTNASLWSLSYEFWYYLVFPLLAWALMAKSVGKCKRVLAVVAALLVLKFVGGQITLLFPIWLAGALVSLATFKAGPRVIQAVTWTGLLLLVLCVGVVRHFDMHATPAEYLIALFTSLLLSGIAAQTWKWPAERGFTPRSGYRRVTKFCSEISYSLYLFHLPLAVFLCALVDSPWRSWNKAPGTVAWYLASDTFIFGCVYLLWRLFEANTDVIRKGVMGFLGQRRSAAGKVAAKVSST